jgi:acetyl esterase/lipase
LAGVAPAEMNMGGRRAANAPGCRPALPAALLLLMAHAYAADPHPDIPLWPEQPGAGPSAHEHVRLNENGEHIISNVLVPSITVYVPAPGIATGAAVVVVPGGGHTELWMDHEGYNVAAFLADHGIAAFVLKYRLAREKGSRYTVERESLADLQRAIRVIRSRSAGWGIDPMRIGVIGFSAGGELAALAGSHYDAGAAGSVDSVERQSSRPDFQALLYPAIPKGLNFSPDSPPAFLLAGAADQPAISQGLAELFLAMRRAGADAELHIYEGLGHGFGLRAGNVGAAAAWPQRFLEWLRQEGLERRRQ